MEDYSQPGTPSPLRFTATLTPLTITHGRGGATSPKPPSPEPPKTITLVQPPRRKKFRSNALRAFRSIFRSFPIISPPCKIPLPSLYGVRLVSTPHKEVMGTGRRITGTIFGYKRGRTIISFQESPRCLPSLVLELGMQMCAIQRELNTGMVRITLECEKQKGEKPRKLLDEPLWTMYCNGKRVGYGAPRKATPEDLNVMELLKAVSMGVGVIPFTAATIYHSSRMGCGADGDGDGSSVRELAYMRAFFEHVVGSKDSESFYMLSPNGNYTSELTIFLVRI